MLDVGQVQKFSIFPNFEQVSRTNTQKVQKLTETDPSFLLKEGAPANIVDAGVDKVQGKDATSNIKPSENFGNYTEVTLYNSDFGFNDSSKDFFIKVSRGTFVDNKYPTDELMRLKSYLNKLNEEVA